MTEMPSQPESMRRVFDFEDDDVPATVVSGVLADPKGFEFPDESRSRRLGKLTQQTRKRDVITGPSHEDSETRSRILGKLDQKRGMQFHDMADFAIIGAEMEVV